MNRIQFRRDTSARWKLFNPILMEGELGLETDTKMRKIGDGVNHWNNLEYTAVENISLEFGDFTNVVISQKTISNELLKDKENSQSKVFTNSKIKNYFNEVNLYKSKLFNYYIKTSSDFKKINYVIYYTDKTVGYYYTDKLNVLNKFIGEKPINKVKFLIYENQFNLGGSISLNIYIGMSENISDINNSKQDKEEGKSLIDSNYAQMQSFDSNPEYAQVVTDLNNNIIEAIKTDSTKVINKLEILDSNIKINNVESCLIENPEYIYLILDKDNNFLFGINNNREVNWAEGIPLPIYNYINNIHEISINNCNTGIFNNDKNINKSIGVCCHITRESNEYLYRKEISDCFKNYNLSLTRTDFDYSFNKSKNIPIFYLNQTDKGLTSFDNAFSSLTDKGILPLPILSTNITYMGSVEGRKKLKNYIKHAVKHFDGITKFISSDKINTCYLPYWEIGNELDYQVFKKALTLEDVCETQKLAFETIKKIKSDNIKVETPSHYLGLNITDVDNWYDYGNGYSCEPPETNKAINIKTIYNGGEYTIAIKNSDTNTLLFVNYYYNSNSSEKLIGGEWSTTLTKTENSHIWHKILIYYESGNLVSPTVVLGGLSLFPQSILYQMLSYKYSDNKHIWDFYDVFNFHFYDVANPESTLIPKILELKNILKNFAIQSKDNSILNKPIWLTETGFSTYDTTEETQAILSQRILIIALAYGIDKVFTYQLRSLEIPWDTSIKESYFGLIHNSLKTSYISLLKPDNKPLSIGDGFNKLVIKTNNIVVNIDNTIIDELKTNGLIIKEKDCTITKISTANVIPFNRKDNLVIISKDSFLDCKINSKINIEFSKINSSEEWDKLDIKPALLSHKFLCDKMPEGSTKPVLDKFDSIYVAHWLTNTNKPIYAIWSIKPEIVEMFDYNDYFDAYNYLGEPILINPKLLQVDKSIIFIENLNKLKIRKV